MSKKLVIVESPAKAKTISRFLGSGFTVKASYGHVRDLPTSKLGIDVEHKFEPEYVIPTKARKPVRELKEEVKKVDELYLATDLDREGEAIAWHLLAAMGVKKALLVKRIVFHEITRSAIEEALKHPREIDQHLVDAQQARRILDRLVGYKLSPLLWKKVYRGLSAGRVQSVAVRLIVEREREIEKFKVTESFTVEAELVAGGKTFTATLLDKDTGRIKDFTNKDEAVKVAKKLLGKKVQLNSLTKTETQTKPQPPLITSSLQQVAARFLGFSAKRTMKIAQELYEGVEGVDDKDGGLITYMRTDSYQLSEQATKQARNLIVNDYGQQYLPESAHQFERKIRGAQEAHEAIRPTNFALKPEDLPSGLTQDQKKLYKLIWQQAMASLMAMAKIETTTARFESDEKDQLQARGRKLLFDGFMKAAPVEEDRYIPLPELKEGDQAEVKKCAEIAHLTEPPARYSEATLVKELEKRGIGRPSTYAPTMSTIVERGYVTKKNGRFFPESVAMVVTDLLVENFPRVVDYDFTADMEESLDDIAKGQKSSEKVLEDFYGPFSKNLAEKEKTIDKKAVVEEKTDEKCPKCQKPLVIKLGRFGKFFACTGFPECEYTAPFIASDDGEKEPLVDPTEKRDCPKCHQPLQLRQGRFGAFWGCSTYPKCDFTEPVVIPCEAKCPNCGKDITRKFTRRGKVFWGCTGYPACKTAFWDEPTKEKCPKCQNLLVKKSGSLKCSQCDYRHEEEPLTEETAEKNG